MKLIELDLSGAEWKIVAYASGDSRMIDVVQSGSSPHSITGSLISGAPVDLVEQEDVVCEHTTDPDDLRELRQSIPGLLDEDYFLPRTMTIRQAGKKANHGLNYGMGYRRFSLENEMSEVDGKKIWWAYSNEAYPGLNAWRQEIKDQLRKDRTLINCFGRKRRFMKEWGPELFDQAYSFIPQSTIADVVNGALLAAYEDRSLVMEPVEFLAQVHDSLLMQYPTEDPARCASFLLKMKEYLMPELTYSGYTFKIGIDAKIGSSWGSMSGLPLNDRYQIIEALEAINGESSSNYMPSVHYGNRAKIGS